MASGLILVDIQNDYFPGGRMELVNMTQASAAAKTLLSLFRDYGWPTFHIQHIAVHEGATFFLPDSTGAELHPSIAPLPGEIIVQKNYPNSFRDTQLLMVLEDEGVDHLVICGAMSHMCIDATTRAAADLEFSCTVVHDACTTKDVEFDGCTIPAEKVHGSFMAALGSAYANLVGLDEFSAEAGTNGLA